MQKVGSLQSNFSKLILELLWLLSLGRIIISRLVNENLHSVKEMGLII